MSEQILNLIGSTAVWRDELWYEMWKMSINDKKWRLITCLYVNKRTCILFEGVSLKILPFKHGVCSIVGLVGSLLRLSFFSVHHTTPRDNFFALFEASSYSGCI